MNLLFVMQTLKKGGAEKVLINLINQMALDKKYNITLLLINNENEYKDEICDKIDIDYIFKKSTKINRSLIKYFPRIFINRVALKKNYDLMIAFMEGEATKIVSCGPKEIQKIAWVHTDMISFPWSERYYLSYLQEKETYCKFNRIIAVSDSAKNSFEKKFGLTCDVYYNCINEKEIKRKANDIHVEAYRKNSFNIVSVGNLKEVKGYERLIETYANFKSRGIGGVCHFLLGDGPEREYLCDYIHKARVEDYIKVIGFVENPYPWIKSADLLVCSSYAEGYSSVICEALILGTPVLTTDCSGMKEILGDSEWGMIVENKSESLLKGIESMVFDEEMYRRYKAKAIERGQSFLISNQVKEIKELFEKIG